MSKSLKALRYLYGLLASITGYMTDEERNMYKLIEKELEALDSIKKHCYIDNNGNIQHRKIEMSWNEYDLIKDVLGNEEKIKKGVKR